MMVEELQSLTSYKSGYILRNVDNDIILVYALLRTTRRLTFDILYQSKDITNQRSDDVYYRFKASNGYEIFSRSRMDIQTDRVWLHGCAEDERSIRSGTMTFSSNGARDTAFDDFNKASEEWSKKGWDNG